MRKGTMGTLIAEGLAQLALPAHVLNQDATSMGYNFLHHCAPVK